MQVVAAYDLYLVAREIIEWNVDVFHPLVASVHRGESMMV